MASVAGAKEINPVMLYGPKARGFGMECPRDKKMGSSYADALDAKHTGPASARCSKNFDNGPKYKILLSKNETCFTSP